MKDSDSAKGGIAALVAFALAVLIGWRVDRKERRKVEEARRKHEDRLAYLQQRNKDYPVELVSINYKGKKYSEGLGEVSSAWFKDKQEAIAT